MAGGSIISWNKIGGGYAAPVRSTGVVLAGERAWRNFGRRIGAAAALDLAKATMAVFCGFWIAVGRVVAWLASHGQAKGLRSQPLGLAGRLIAGLTDGSRPRSIAGRGLPPFGRPPVTTRVASASRQRGEIQVRSGLIRCLKLRLGQTGPMRQDGSGPGAVLNDPQFGVGGAGAPEKREKSRLAGREAALAFGNPANGEHRSRAPLSKRVAGDFLPAFSARQARRTQICGYLAA